MTQTPEEKVKKLCDNMHIEVKKVITRYGMTVIRSNDLPKAIYVNSLAWLCVDIMTLLGGHLNAIASNHKSKRIPELFEEMKKESLEKTEKMRKRIMKELP